MHDDFDTAPAQYQDGARYHAEFDLQEEAERLAAMAGQSIEHALRICGPEMFTKVTGFVVTPVQQ